MAKELRYKVTKDKGKKSEVMYEGTDKNEAMSVYTSTKPDKGGKVHLAVGQYEGEKLIGGLSFIKIKGDAMKNVKYVCGSCKAEISDSSKFCTSCGVKLKPIGDKVKPEDLANVIATIKKILKDFGYSAASKDVSTETYERYAQWILGHVKNKIYTIDPVSRKKTKNDKMEDFFNKFVADFKKLGLPVKVTLKDSVEGIMDLNNLGRFRKAHQALRDTLTHLGVFSHIPELKKYEDDAIKLQVGIEKFLNKVGKPKITSDSTVLDALVDGEEFNYMLLSRLQSDNDYFLGNGRGNEKDLWAGSVEKQIAKMRELWKKVPEKPEWLSMAQIKKYEKDMLNLKRKLEKAKNDGIELDVIDDAGPLKEEDKDKLKEKIKSVLLKRGNNPDDVDKMLKQEFEGAFSVFRKNGGTPSKIAEYIRTVY